MSAGMFPCSWCSSCVTLNVKTERILLNFGKYQGTLREPGCYCINTCGTTRLAITLCCSAFCVAVHPCQIDHGHGFGVLLQHRCQHCPQLNRAQGGPLYCQLVASALLCLWYSL